MPYAPINGQEIFFEDSQGSGYPIVMMHGFLMDQSLFDHQVKALAPLYRCIRFDARAFGRTKWDELPFNLYDTVADCIGLMDYLGLERANIIGMSQGGYAALRLALRHPHRVNALVLMSTQSGVDDEMAKLQYRQMQDTWVKLGPVEPLIEGLATALLGPKEAPGMAAHWQAWLPKWRSCTGTAIFHAMNSLFDREDITPALPEIEHPSLVTHGDNDIGMPIMLGEQLSKRLKNCQGFVVVSGAAHAANLTHPHVINPPLLSFLKNL